MIYEIPNINNYLISKKYSKIYFNNNKKESSAYPKWSFNKHHQHKQQQK
jgi:hypothetical protein